MNAKMSQIRRISSANSNLIARGQRAVMEALECRRLMSAIPGLPVIPGLPDVNVNGVDLNQTITTTVTGTITKATQAVVTSVPLSLSAGGNGVVVVHLADATGNVDLSQSGVVTLSIASGPTGATLGGTVTATASHGVATFPGVSMTKSGDYTLKATAAGLTAGVSSNVKVIAGTASQLAVLSQPVLSLLGKVLQPAIVAVEDAFGNVVTTADSVVTLATQTPASAASATLVAMAPVAQNLGISSKAVNGVATFSELPIATTVTSVLTATSTALATAKPTPVAVTPAHSAATSSTTSTPKPVEAPIATVTAGAKSSGMSIDVSTALPAAAGKGATAQLSIASATDGTVAMTGTVKVKAGLAMLPSLNIHAAGTYVMTLTDAGGASVSHTVVVQPSAVAKLVFTKLPTVLNDKAAVAVQAIDKWGNATKLADGSTITLSLGKGSTYGKLAALTGATAAMVKDGVATFTGGLAVSGAINPGGYAKLTASLGKLTVSTNATYTIA